MGANVFANGMEISGKASDNKSVAAMPDVCMSPPSPPAGPVPIPYPNTAMASDTADGTKTVTIGGKEAGMKNSSTYSKSTGDEPATQSFGANVGSHKIQGAMKFSAWSSDVKLEGANAIRMGDLTTHNHANPQGISGVTGSVAGMKPPTAQDCQELKQKNKQVRNQMRHSKSKGVRGVGKGKTTITHALYAVGGRTYSMRACSRALVMKFKGGGFLKGRRTAGKKGGSSTICGQKHEYPGGRPKTSHTESRIIETILRNSAFGEGGTLTLAIDWNKSKTPNDPCDACRDLICKASQKPDGCLTILICKGKGPPKPPDCV
jgi:hypothetical protein